MFLPDKSHGQRSLVGYSPWGRKASDTTERLTLIGGVNSESTSWRQWHISLWSQFTVGLIECSFSPYQVAYFYSTFLKAGSVFMLLEHLIAYFTCPFPMLGRPWSWRHVMWSSSSSSCAPWQIWACVVLILQMRKLRLREAKLSCTTDKQVVEPQSVGLCSHIYGHLKNQWSTAGNTMWLTLFLPQWPSDQGYLETRGCWGHKEYAFRVSHQAQAWAHQGITQASNNRKQWPPPPPQRQSGGLWERCIWHWK